MTSQKLGQSAFVHRIYGLSS